jgi:DNA (cytosine-5)-methyltransferase 1
MTKSFSRDGITIGTAFSGIGAPEEALRKLNLKHKVLFACDIDKHAKEAYLANNSLEEEYFFEDITLMNVTNFKDHLDVYIGGSPCQSFSTYGKQLGLNDDRGNLFKHYIKIIEQSFPKYFIWENVSSVLTNDKGKSWEVIQNEFSNLCQGKKNRSYSIQYIIINSNEIGFPQNRSRIFVIGSRRDNIDSLDIWKPLQVERDKTAIDLLDKDLSILNEFPPIKDKKLEFVTSPKCDKNGYTRIHNTKSPHENNGLFACQTARQITNWHGNFVYHPLDKSQSGSIQPSQVFANRFVSITQWNEFMSSSKNRAQFLKYFKEMKAHEATLSLSLPFVSGDSIEHGINNYQAVCRYLFVKYQGKVEFGPHGIIRPTTPRENLRLMGFSDSFKIVTSNSQTYKQAGNSMVVDVIAHLLEQLFTKQKNRPKNFIRAKELTSSKTKEIFSI